jgi:hypothetical protein
MYDAKMTLQRLTDLQNVLNKQFRKLKLAHGGFTHGKGEDARARIQALQVRRPCFHNPYDHILTFAGADTSVVKISSPPHATQKESERFSNVKSRKRGSAKQRSQEVQANDRTISISNGYSACCGCAKERSQEIEAIEKAIPISNGRPEPSPATALTRHSPRVQQPITHR